MGVGINEASKLVGTAVTASVAGRMIGNEKAQALEQGSAANEANIKDKALAKDFNEQIPDAEFEVEKADDNIKIMEAGLNATMKDPKATPEQRLSAAVNMQQALDDKTAAKRALDELQTKLEATQERLARQEKAMARGRRWGGSY